MIKTRIVILIASAVFLFAGCLKVNTTITVNPDGSGKLEETVLMKDDVIDMMKEFAASFSDSADSEPFEFYKEDEAREKASKYGEGVKFSEGNTVKVEGWEGYKVVYTFSDITKLRVSPDPEDKVELGAGEPDEMKKPKQIINFDFKKGNPSELTVIFPKGDMKISDDNETEEVQNEDDPEALENISKLMDGMQIAMYLKTNGKISSTNATFSDESEITLALIDFGELLNNKDALMNFSKSRPETFDDLRELTKDIKGIKIELQDKISVKFK